MSLLTLSLLAQIVVVGLLIWVAWYDIRKYTIRNRVVLVMLLLYLPAQGALGFPTWPSDLGAGALLFGIGFVMWMMRGLGAGDAKLMFPLGMHLGFIALVPFSMLLMITSIFLFAAIQIAHLMKSERGLGGWLAGMKTGGRVPYGLVLAVSAIPVMALRIYWLA